MLLVLIAYLGGVLTILSPCILPMLPFVFARADRPFVQGALPMLAGMVLTFAAVATLAALGGGWAVHANQFGRNAALVLMALFGLTLVVPSLADRLSRPLVALGAKLMPAHDETSPTILSSGLLGVGVGLLWAPCAGPILGLVLTGAALSGANLTTSLLLFAYAAGAATSLAMALLVGGRVFTALKKSLGAGEWVRRAFGVAVMGAVLLIATGMDTGFLTRLSLGTTSALEEKLVDLAAPPSSVVMSEDAGAMMSNNAMMAGNAMMMTSEHGGAAAIEGALPPLTGATAWLNSPPLTAEALKGKVVLIDFWTYSCINCLRSIPHVRAWAEKYKDQGLVVIGVHAPEFAFEHDIANVKAAVKDLNIGYPVAIDNDFALWRAFGNSYWPAHYFIDAKGNIRHHHFGEGGYDESEQMIQTLLAETGATPGTVAAVPVAASGAEAEADLSQVKSPETYVGFGRAQNFASAGGVVPGASHDYTAPPTLTLNQWGLSGAWTVAEESAESTAAHAYIAFQFHARDLHLVLGTSGKPVRFRVLIDGQPPKDSHGMDTDADGNGVVTAHRLYQLIRQTQPIVDHRFDIEFLDPGVQAFAFTFG